MEQNEKKRKAPEKATSRTSNLKTNKKIKAVSEFLNTGSDSDFEEEDRVRTPSGTVIDAKVKDIRSFFLQKS